MGVGRLPFVVRLVLKQHFSTLPKHLHASFTQALFPKRSSKHSLRNFVEAPSEKFLDKYTQDYLLNNC